ncbi:Ger(x)C family spore germination protein [Paenibacillus sp. GCM10023248]|uniref:Ger(x)C family spore germination protein n=1 Tax=Bacillales TaxID=1385 RepID=UPI002377DB8A|nr:MULTISPECIES: Ger(x)C family spore germination protein [Bacillales]MDD9265565.1 Ger(x)C family spore germination protein [Paenibacillus sp. MAHUQ-63]
MKRLIGAFGLFACIIILSGCWSRIEINDRAFVTAMFIDYPEDGVYEVSLGFPLPNRMATGIGLSLGGTSGNPYSIVTKRGESIPVAIRKIRSDLSREISWGHCRVIVIGRKMAELGIDQLLEFTAREPNFHTKTFLFVSPTTGKDIANLTPVFERLPSEVLREFAQRNVTLGATIKDFLEAEASGGDMVTGLLTIGQMEMVSEKGKMSTWVGTDGAALFKSGTMVGTLDVIGMRAGLWLNGKMMSSMNSIHSPTDGKTISFLIQTSKSSITPIVHGDKIEFSIRIEAEDDVLSSESNLDLMDPEQIRMLESLLSEQLKDRVTRTLRTTQSKGADVFNFGKMVSWKYPKKWKEIKSHWRETYANCEFHVDARIFVKRTGTEKNTVIRD